MKVVIVSGYFNPLHIGHIRLFQAARKLGDKLLVIVNNDDQQLIKKGKIIMSENDRLEIIKLLRIVDDAMLSLDTDHSVSKTLESIADTFSGKELIFANGGDRNSTAEIPESDTCSKCRIQLAFGIGGSKRCSSTDINTARGK